MIVQGKTYALIIGVEDYINNDKFRKVRYAQKDAGDLANALEITGTRKADIKILLNGLATKTTITNELDKLTRLATEDDRIFFFFAGHGVFHNETNWIVPSDAYNDDITGTCVKISQILGQLKKSRCKRSIVLFDCCHSGYTPGIDERHSATTFEVEDLLYIYRDEEYCYGFASAKENEISISSDLLKNGVWTHFLVKAIKGEAESKLYENGVLFNDNLQGYLNKNVNQYVQLNTSDRKIQTPVSFGNQTDRFPISNVKEILEDKLISKSYEGMKFSSVTMLSKESEKVKNLDGFNKGYHTVPQSIYHGAENFIKSISGNEIKNEIDEIINLLPDLKYKRKQVEAITEEGQGSISTPDFIYSVVIEQSETDSDEYVIIRTLEGFKNSSIIEREEFNNIFSRHFDELRFTVNSEIQIEEIIDTIEDLESDEISVRYDPSNLSYCDIQFASLSYEVHVETNSISITYYRKTNPEGLAEAFKDTYEALLQQPELKLLK